MAGIRSTQPAHCPRIDPLPHPPHRLHTHPRMKRQFAPSGSLLPLQPRLACCVFGFFFWDRVFLGGCLAGRGCAKTRTCITSVIQSGIWIWRSTLLGTCLRLVCHCQRVRVPHRPYISSPGNCGPHLRLTPLSVVLHQTVHIIVIAAARLILFEFYH